MAQDIYWADSYVEKQCSAAQAIKKIRQGQRVFIGSACGEPQELVRCLAENAIHFSGLEIVRMMSTESVSLSEIADKTMDASLNIRNIYLGAASADTLARKNVYLEYAPEVSEWLLERCGSDRQAGARPLRRLIQLWIDDAVADYLISHRHRDRHDLNMHISSGRPLVSGRDSLIQVPEST